MSQPVTLRRPQVEPHPAVRDPGARLTPTVQLSPTAPQPRDEPAHTVAMDLHDFVIARLYGAGLSLLAMRDNLPAGRQAEQLEVVVNDLDATIAQLRDVISTLRHGRDSWEDDDEALMRAIDDAGRVLGFAPSFESDGLSRHDIPADVVHDMVAVVREGVSNVARHADASEVTVSVEVDDSALCVRVRDNGVGMRGAHRQGGLNNLAERAEMRQGAFGVESDAHTGTTLNWRVPLATVSREHRRVVR